jgi:hypothetical protein
MKIKASVFVTFAVFCASLFFSGCVSAPTLRTIAASELANKAITAVVENEGGPKAGAIASAGLYAAADVLQGYVDKKPPLEVMEKSPGVAGVGQLIVSYLKDKGYVTQDTVNKIHGAAAIAANITVSGK